MVTFTATIQKFEEQGEKTGWTYIEIPADIAGALKPGSKQSFRVKGRLDAFPIEAVALIPMGGGRFIMAINAAMRRGIKKGRGAMLQVKLSVDTKPVAIPADLRECLADEPEALAFLQEMKLSHRNYYIKWLDGVKTEAARTKRIARIITALSQKQDFVTMIRSLKKG